MMMGSAMASEEDSGSESGKKCSSITRITSSNNLHSQPSGSLNGQLEELGALVEHLESSLKDGNEQEACQALKERDVTYVLLDGNTKFRILSLAVQNNLAAFFEQCVRIQAFKSYLQFSRAYDVYVWQTLLHAAIKNGASDIVAWYLRNSEAGVCDKTAILLAARLRGDNVKILWRLLEFSYSNHTAEEHHELLNHALNEAVKAERWLLGAFLIRKGASIETVDKIARHYLDAAYQDRFNEPVPVSMGIFGRVYSTLFEIVSGGSSPPPSPTKRSTKPMEEEAHPQKRVRNAQIV